MTYYFSSLSTTQRSSLLSAIDPMAQKLAIFSAQFTGIRIKTIKGLIERENRSKATKVLMDTIDDIATLPCNFGEELRENLVSCLNEAFYLMALECFTQIIPQLETAQEMLQNHMRSMYLAKNILQSFEDTDVGALAVLPLDVRREIWELVSVDFCA